ncbi:hypothetical protein ACFQ9X_54390 [Catenulispora yoronensis]
MDNSPEEPPAGGPTSGLTLPGGGTYRKQVEKSIADAARLCASVVLDDPDRLEERRHLKQ